MNESCNSTIEFRNVEYRVTPDRLLLTGLNLVVKRAETLMLLGRSGSGKTTCLKLINRLLVPTAGDVLVNNKGSQDWDPIRLRRGIGYAIQDVGLFPHYTVWENVALVPKLERWDQPRIAHRVEEVLHLVGLPARDFRDRYPNQLSGGQRQRVGLARALAAEPPILLMDEPFGALDALTRRTLQDELLRIWDEYRKTIVFVTHSIEESVYLADRVAVMTYRPGTIKRDVRIAMPRPRDTASAEFNTLKKELANLVMEEQKRLTETEIKGYTTD